MFRKMFSLFKRTKKVKTRRPEFPKEIKDPIEKDPRFLAVIDDVEKELREIKEMECNNEFVFGYVHRYWYLKKKILKEKYNIDWKSPQEMNPWICYD